MSSLSLKFVLRKKVNMENKQPSNLFIIRESFLKLEGMNLDRLKVYQEILQFFLSGKTCFMTNKTFSQRTGCCEERVSRAISYFSKHKQLEKTTMDNKRHVIIKDTMSRKEILKDILSIPRSVSNLPGMTFRYLKVYAEMFKFFQKGKPCLLTNEELEERSGVSRRQAVRAINYFVKHNQIERTIKTGKSRSIIMVEHVTKKTTVDHPKLEEKISVDKSPKRGVRITKEGCQNYQNGVTELPNIINNSFNKQEFKNHIREKSPKSFSSSKRKHPGDDFLKTMSEEEIHAFHQLRGLGVYKFKATETVEIYTLAEIYDAIDVTKQASVRNPGAYVLAILKKKKKTKNRKAQALG